MNTDADSEDLRPVYLCQDCGAHYLPPVSMEYPDGPASQVFCSHCQPRHSLEEQGRPGVDLTERLAKPRRLAPRRAGRAPIKGGSTQRSKLL